VLSTCATFISAILVQFQIAQTIIPVGGNYILDVPDRQQFDIAFNHFGLKNNWVIVKDSNGVIVLQRQR